MKYLCNKIQLQILHRGDEHLLIRYFNRTSIRPNLFLLTICFLLAACSYRHGMVPFKEGNKYGFTTLDGKKILIKPQYDETGWGFCNGYLDVKKNGKWGAINADGKLTVPLKYDDIGSFSTDGIAEAKTNELYGFIDTNGKEIIPFQYTDTWGFNKGIAHVNKDEKWGMIDVKGNIVIPIEYDRLDWDFSSEGLIGARNNGKWGFIDKNNNTVIPFIYYEAEMFSEGLAAVAISYDTWGFINVNNDTVIPFKYQDPSSCDWKNGGFKNGIVTARQNHLSGFMNTKGEIIIPIKYNCIKSFNKGYAFASIDNGESIFGNNHKYLFHGYVDSTGKEFFVPYERYRDYDWKVSAAPELIPDYSDTLIKVTYIYESNATFDVVYDGAITFTEDSTMEIVYDTSTHIVDYTNDTSYILDHETQESPKIMKEKWTLEKLLNLALTAFREEPITYPNLDRLTEVSISYGLMLGGGNFGEDFMYPKENLNVFKKETLYKIISSETLRKVTWNWISPYYRQSYNTMHPFHQQAYKDIASHLRSYINSYDAKKMNAYLKRDEAKFAHYDSDGKYNPYRKICAFVDRLILVHKVLSVEDAKVWINKIADEVQTW